MSESFSRRRIGALAALVVFAVIVALVEQRILVPFATSRPAPEEVQYWRQHVERNPKTAESHLRLALAFAKAGQLKDAEAAFDTALILQPGYHAAAVGRYGVAVERGEAERALDVLEGYAAQYPRCGVCWQNLAAAHLANRNLESARAAVEALLASDLNVESRMYNIEDMQVEALVMAGRVHAALGDRPRAIGFFRSAIEADPNELRAYVLQAKNLLASNDPAAALDVLEQASAVPPARDGAGEYARLQREIERLMRRARQIQP